MEKELNFLICPKGRAMKRNGHGREREKMGGIERMMESDRKKNQVNEI